MSPEEGIVTTIQAEGTAEKSKMSAFNENLKRIFDCAASCGGMIVFSPLILGIHIAIKCDSKGPAIFKQERIGRGGKPFTLYKFRSMRITSGSDGKPALCSRATRGSPKSASSSGSAIWTSCLSFGMSSREI